MKQSRLDGLADGIFAIVMTILVFEIRMPHFNTIATNADIITGLIQIIPLFLSYLLSFSLLFTYWRAHHFIVSIYAKNVDLHLTNISAIFFFFVGLVPFSSRLLGENSTIQVPILFFSFNILCIAWTLYHMRTYVRDSKTIETGETNRIEERHAFMRILFPAYCAIVAAVLCFFSTTLALVLLTFGLLYNLLPGSTKFTFYVIDTLAGRKTESES